MNFIALLVFIVVQILFILLGIIGIILVFYKQMYSSKKLGVSSTAIKVINGRWTMDVFGMRKDNATVKLNRVLPNNSLLGMWLILFPSYLRYKISGQNKVYPCFAKPGEEGLANIVTSAGVKFSFL